MEYVPLHNVFPRFQCPLLNRVWCKSRADLWNIPKFMSARNVVLIVPEQGVAETPGAPSSYQVVREFVDRSIEYPVPVALRVYQLSRMGAAATDGAVVGPRAARYTSRKSAKKAERKPPSSPRRSGNAEDDPDGKNRLLALCKVQWQSLLTNCEPAT